MTAMTREPPAAPPRVQIVGLRGIPEIAAGDDLAAVIAEAIRREQLSLDSGHIVVVTQKIVSKAEGRAVRLEDVEPSGLARRWGAAYARDPRLIEVILGEARRIVRMERGLIIAETAHGFVCANAGVDSSNVEHGTVLRLPEDPTASARRIREGLGRRIGAAPAVIVSDSFGRPWRQGIVNVAIGVAGGRPLADYRGDRDPYGHLLQSTVMAVADEVASAAELVMGKIARVPVAVVSGYRLGPGEGSGQELLRPPDQDLFR